MMSWVPGGVFSSPGPQSRSAGQLVRGKSGHGHFPRATITQLVFLIKKKKLSVTCGWMKHKLESRLLGEK